MKIEDFLPNVTWIGKHIQACKTPDQIKNMRSFYNMVISQQWFPDVSVESINESRKHLNKLIEDLKIRED